MTVWLTAMGLIATVIICWLFAIPIFKGFNEQFDDMINFTDNPAANKTYTQINALATSAFTFFLYGFIAVIILWAYASMQRREEYSGAYR